ncbi:hypothetical protein GCM10009865_08130 [Aeromicrobium ponti]
METLDESAKTSFEEIIDLLLPHTDLSINHLTLLMSAVGQTQISQIADPLLTERFFVPRTVLISYNVCLFK